MKAIKKSLILIVDDTPQNIQVLGNILYEKGYNISISSSGAQALQSINKQAPDLILLDIQMPEMDGYQVCEVLKSNPLTKDIPVIFLTAATESENIVQGFELGAVDYIAKPFNVAELLMRVATHIELKLKREQLQQINIWLEDKIKERTFELEKANAELLNLDKVKTDFLSMISHEIRIPLNRIKEPIELLKYKVENKSLAELVEIIDQSVVRLEKFSSQAMEITQLRTNRYVKNNTEVSIAGIIEYALLSIQKQLTEKMVNIVLNIQKDQKITGDSDLLVKCFANILRNACKYSQNEGKIVIGATELAEELIVEIKDFGLGMDNETVNNLSEMLTPGEIQFEQNIGLGLFHSKLLAEAHDGSIQIKSALGKGTTVTVTFPNNKSKLD